MKVFSVYDSKSESYDEPFVQKTIGEAKRGFALATENEKSRIGKWPEDFTLFELGEWDPHLGVMKPHEAKISHGLALEYRKQPDTTPIERAIERVHHENRMQ